MLLLPPGSRNVPGCGSDCACRVATNGNWNRHGVAAVTCACTVTESVPICPPLPATVPWNALVVGAGAGGVGGAVDVVGAVGVAGEDEPPLHARAVAASAARAMRLNRIVVRKGAPIVSSR